MRAWRSSCGRERGSLLAVTRRLQAMVVPAVLALAGCATAVRPVTVVPMEDPALVQQDCHQWAATTVESRVLSAAFQSGALAGTYLALRGAADGAWWGFIAGGGRGAKDGAWIGAAAGAGIGMIIGVVVGVKEGVDAYGRYRSAFDVCVAGRTMPPGDGEAASVESPHSNGRP